MNHNMEYYDKLAQRVARVYRHDPLLTLGQIAERLQVDEQDIIFVLHHYDAADPELAVYVGPGQGGNWVPVEQQQATFGSAAEPYHIGYRWPDGSLRDVPPPEV